MIQVIQVILVIQVIQVVRVARMISLDELHSDNIEREFIFIKYNKEVGTTRSSR